MIDVVEFLGVVYAIAIGLAVLDFRLKCRSPYIHKPLPAAKATYR